MPPMLNTGTTTQFPEPLSRPTLMTQDQLAELFETRREELLALIRRKLRSRLGKRLEPTDILQDAFIRACKHREWLSDSLTPEELSKKLRRIVFEEMTDRIRQHLGPRRNPEGEVHFPDESYVQLAMGLYHSRSTPSKESARRELIAKVREALNQLDAIDRQILLFRSYSKLSYNEIGDRLALRPNTVNQRYLRAIKKLGELLPPLESLC
jgi:RNA polymerase sigma-70 factor (ECF subfamily)